MQDWFVYFLRSEKSHWYYVGSTNRLEKRIREHNQGRVSATKPYKPFKLVYKIRFNTEKEAREREKKIKSMRIEKERIIREIEST